MSNLSQTPCAFCRINQQCQQYYHSNGTTNQQHIQAIQNDELTHGTVVLAETSHCTIFQPRDSVAQSHLLIVTKSHINNLNDVTYNHIELLQHMVSTGYYCMVHEDQLANNSTGTSIQQPTQINDKQLIPYNDIHYDIYARGWVPQNGFRFVFHRPPFNSIDHLHLHTQRLPYLYYSSIAMYAPGTWWCADASDIIKELRIKKAAALKNGTYKPAEPVINIEAPSTPSTVIELGERSSVMD